MTSGQYRPAMARPLSAEADAKMLGATLEIIRDAGVDGVTIEEVARRSGVAKTTIYRHASSGTELVVRAVTGLVDDIEVPDTGSLAGDLRALVASFIDLTADEVTRRVFVAVLHHAATNSEFEALYRSLVMSRRSPVAQVVERARARGEVDVAVDLDMAVDLVEGPLVVRRLVVGEHLRAAQADQLVDLVVRALAPRG
jgi:AcrR family transcriptional regulator